MFFYFFLFFSFTVIFDETSDWCSIILGAWKFRFIMHNDGNRIQSKLLKIIVHLVLLSTFVIDI